MSRSDIRAATVAAQARFASKTVNVNGQDVEIRQPNIKQRSEILRLAKAQSGDKDRVDLASLSIESIIRCCYVPGTNEKVFGDADRDTLAEMPSGSFVDDLASAALGLMNVDKEEAEKK